MKQSFRRLLQSPSAWVTIAIVALLAALTIVTIVYWESLGVLFSDKEQLKVVVERAGWWGPLVFIGVQFLQVIIAPIPGQAIGVLAGALFGPLLGTIYSMIGALLGFTTIFMISRRLGRPFVERFVEAKHLKKFDYLTNANGPMVFFLIFLLPAFPDDIICYLAGLSSIPIRTLVLVSLLGRLPGYLVLSLFGSGLAETDIRLIVGIVTAVVLISAVVYWQRERLESWIHTIGSSNSTSRKE